MSFAGGWGSCLGRGHKRRLLSFAAVSVAANSPPGSSPLLRLLQNSLSPPVPPPQAAVGQLSSLQALGLAEGQRCLRPSLSRERRRFSTEGRAVSTFGSDEGRPSTKPPVRSARITTQSPTGALSGRRGLAPARLRSASSAADEGVECSPVASTQRRRRPRSLFERQGDVQETIPVTAERRHRPRLSGKEMCRRQYPSQAIAETPCL
jgi:hypothetical protein